MHVTRVTKRGRTQTSRVSALSNCELFIVPSLLILVQQFVRMVYVYRVTSTSVHPILHKKTCWYLKVYNDV